MRLHVLLLLTLLGLGGSVRLEPTKDAPDARAARARRQITVKDDFEDDDDYVWEGTEPPEFLDKALAPTHHPNPVTELVNQGQDDSGRIQEQAPSEANIGQDAGAARRNVSTVKPSIAQVQPTPEAPPTEAPPTEAPPTDAPPTEAPPTEAPPTDAPPTEAPPTEAPPTEAPPTEAQPTEALPMEPPPTESMPAEAPPTETTPTETTPTEAPPTEAPPIETMPTEAPPIETTSTETTSPPPTTATDAHTTRTKVMPYDRALLEMFTGPPGMADPPTESTTTKAQTSPPATWDLTRASGGDSFHGKNGAGTDPASAGIPSATRASDHIPVKQCLLAILILALVATVFLVCTVVLAVRLSRRKHMYPVRSYSPTEMVCISALLPEGGGQGSAANGGPLTSKSAGPKAEAGEESGGDDLTLRSFLP